MKNRKRLGSIETKLNVRQLVSVHIQEARKYSSAMSYARAMSGPPSWPPTLCMRIAELYPQAGRDSDPVVQHEVRCAVREGLFLAHLWGGCAMSIVEEWRVWALEAQVLSYRLLLMWAVDATKREPMAEWLDDARAHLRTLEDHLAAVRIIEREYFGGTNLLFRDDEARVVGMISSIESMVAEAEQEFACVPPTVEEVQCPTSRNSGDQTTGPRERPAPSAQAFRIASELVRLAKSHAHWACDEAEQAVAVLTPVALGSA